ncbi:MAG: LysE family translocator [Sulfitobacter sp.]
MIHYWELATALAVYTIVLIVPGPNMVLVFNHSLKGDRRAGVVSGLGFGLAATVLALASYLGLASLRSFDFNLDGIMYAISGSILIWFSYKLSIGSSEISADMGARPARTTDGTNFSAAFLLNISNPKALALLTGIYGGPLASITTTEAAFFIIFCMILEFVWYYFLVALFVRLGASKLSQKFIKRLSLITNCLLGAAGAYLLWQAYTIMTN